MPLAAEFHAAHGLPAPDQHDLVPDAELVRLRTRLLRAEFERAVVLLGSLARVSDPNQSPMAYRAVLTRLATLRYVIDATAVALGLPIDAAVEEVHRAHLRANPSDGSVPRPDLTGLVPDIIEIEEAAL